MGKTRNQKKPTKQIYQSQNHPPKKTEKPPSWAVVRGLLTCKHLQTPQLQEQKQQTATKQKKQQQKEQAAEENAKKCKKMKCSGSLCSNTKVMHRPETGSPEVHKKRALVGGSSNSEVSSRSMKAPLNEINGVVSTSSSSLSVSSTSSVGGSFRGMPFRRFSGCYECRMVVDPVLGFARDPSLRGSICSCPECGEIFMKAENLELHQAVRHAGNSTITSIFFTSFFQTLSRTYFFLYFLESSEFSFSSSEFSFSCHFNTRNPISHTPFTDFQIIKSNSFRTGS